jgi:hypothetical protein
MKPQPRENVVINRKTLNPNLEVPARARRLSFQSARWILWFFTVGYVTVASLVLIADETRFGELASNFTFLVGLGGIARVDVTSSLGARRELSDDGRLAFAPARRAAHELVPT